MSRRQEKPIDPRQMRLGDIRIRIYEIGSIKRQRELTIVETHEYQRLNDERTRLQAEIEGRRP